MLFVGRRPLFIGSFYRPPNDNPESLIRLHQEVSKLTERTTLPNIILTGDFNMPHINWETSTINKGNNKPQYGLQPNLQLLELINTNVLIQMQLSPSRGDNILDLVLATLPDQITKVETVPGMSDHEAISVTLGIAKMYKRKKPRTVYLYKRGDMHGLRDALNDFKDDFLNSNPLERGVQANWDLLKNKSFELLTTICSTKNSVIMAGCAVDR